MKSAPATKGRWRRLAGFGEPVLDDSGVVLRVGVRAPGRGEALLAIKRARGRQGEAVSESFGCQLGSVDRLRAMPLVVHTLPGLQGTDQHQEEASAAAYEGYERLTARTEEALAGQAT